MKRCNFFSFYGRIIFVNSSVNIGIVYNRCYSHASVCIWQPLSFLTLRTKISFIFKIVVRLLFPFCNKCGLSYTLLYISPISCSYQEREEVDALSQPIFSVRQLQTDAINRSTSFLIGRQLIPHLQAQVKVFICLGTYLVWKRFNELL